MWFGESPCSVLCHCVFTHDEKHWERAKVGKGMKRYETVCFVAIVNFAMGCGTSLTAVDVQCYPLAWRARLKALLLIPYQKADDIRIGALYITLINVWLGTVKFPPRQLPQIAVFSCSGDMFPDMMVVFIGHSWHRNSSILPHSRLQWEQSAHGHRHCCSEIEAACKTYPVLNQSFLAGFPCEICDGAGAVIVSYHVSSASIVTLTPRCLLLCHLQIPSLCSFSRQYILITALNDVFCAAIL